MKLNQFLIVVLMVSVLAAYRVSAASLSFEIVSIAEAQLLEREHTGIIYGTTIWMRGDTILHLQYGHGEWLLNVSKRSGSVAVRLQ